MQKELVEVALSTLKFYKYEEDGLVFYEFDATKCSPPEPMVNAINGLRMLKNENDRLVGIFFHEPLPLYEKIGSMFSHEAQELQSGDVRVVFKKSNF
ncbi:DUF2249 domain-containing protein [bacterium]|nr:DUF2249 domain-containing protein [bacterium]MBU1993958.1 DUF2249 domain-containing protein [bacterium]